MNKHEIDRIFYSDGYRLGQSVIAESYSEEALAMGIEQLYSAIDGLIDSLLQQAKRNRVVVDCTKGCAWCCHQPIFAHTFEIQYLANQVRKVLPAEKVDELRKRATTKNYQVKTLQEKEMLHYKSPCPLLENNACIAYHARPMACRIYLSTNVASCRWFYSRPDDPENYPALLDFPLKAGRMLNHGFMAALKQHGFAVTEYRIEEGLSGL